MACCEKVALVSCLSTRGASGGAERRTVTTPRVRSTVRLSRLYNPDPPMTPTAQQPRISGHLRGKKAQLEVKPRDRWSRLTDERRVGHELRVSHGCDNLFCGEVARKEPRGNEILRDFGIYFGCTFGVRL